MSAIPEVDSTYTTMPVYNWTEIRRTTVLDGPVKVTGLYDIVPGADPVPNLQNFTGFISNLPSAGGKIYCIANRKVKLPDFNAMRNAGNLRYTKGIFPEGAERPECVFAKTDNMRDWLLLGNHFPGSNFMPYIHFEIAHPDGPDGKISIRNGEGIIQMSKALAGLTPRFTAHATGNVAANDVLSSLQADPTDVRSLNTALLHKMAASTADPGMLKRLGRAALVDASYLSETRGPVPISVGDILPPSKYNAAPQNYLNADGKTVDRAKVGLNAIYQAAAYVLACENPDFYGFMLACCTNKVHFMEFALYKSAFNPITGQRGPGEFAIPELNFGGAAMDFRHGDGFHYDCDYPGMNFYYAMFLGHLIAKEEVAKVNKDFSTVAVRLLPHFVVPDKDVIVAHHDRLLTWVQHDAKRTELLAALASLDASFAKLCPPYLARLVDPDEYEAVLKDFDAKIADAEARVEAAKLTSQTTKGSGFASPLDQAETILKQTKGNKAYYLFHSVPGPNTELRKRRREIADAKADVVEELRLLEIRMLRSENPMLEAGADIKSSMPPI